MRKNTIWIIITFIILCVKTFYSSAHPTVESILTFAFFIGILFIVLTASKKPKKQITMQKVIVWPILLFIILSLFSYLFTDNTFTESIVGAAILPVFLLITLGITRDLEKE